MADVPKRILYIEDEPFFARTIVAKMEENGFAAKSLPDGESGIKELGQEHYDLVLLDLTLAKMDGLEVLQKIKEDPKMKHTPVVVLSNRSSEEDQARARELGAAQYLVKVQSMPAEIFREVKKILELS